MSEEKLYVVKNDEGQYFDIDLPPWWDEKAGNAFKRIDLALGCAKKYGGHVVTLIEEPKKVVISKEQAEIVDDAHSDEMPAGYIFSKSDDEELLMKAYVNGYTVAKEPKYLVWVKLPDTGAQFYKERLNGQPRWERRDKTDLFEASWYQFTKSEVEQLKSAYQYIEIKEVTDDAD